VTSKPLSLFLLLWLGLQAGGLTIALVVNPPSSVLGWLAAVVFEFVLVGTFLIAWSARRR
jgi:hypothetical protein